MIKQKLYVCCLKEDPEKKECLATQLYADRYDVLCFGMWRQYFAHELENIRPAKLVIDHSPAVQGG